jgi:hypothetical protein
MFTWNLPIPAVIFHLNEQANVSAESIDTYLEPWIFYIFAVILSGPLSIFFFLFEEWKRGYNT